MKTFSMNDNEAGQVMCSDVQFSDAALRVTTLQFTRTGYEATNLFLTPEMAKSFGEWLVAWAKERAPK